jgi:predicted dithiol-disulfide oxidoreductase (DUF899 family)
MSNPTILAAANGHPVVSSREWTEARKQLLAREKALTKLHDEVARERRALPWRRLEKDHVFDTPEGPRTLVQLFAGRRQLVVQHFMFGPGWEQGCPSCSYMADHTDGIWFRAGLRARTGEAGNRGRLPSLPGVSRLRRQRLAPLRGACAG